MKTTLAYSLALFAVLAAGVTVYAQCSGPSCSAGRASVVIEPTAGYQWVPVPNDADNVALYFRTLQVGTYNYETGFYTPIIGGRWGNVCKSPIAPPFGARSGHAGSPFFGVTTNHLTGRERIWNGDGTYNRGQFEEMIGANLKDDSKAAHLTLVTNKPDLAKKALADFEAAKAKDPNAAKVRFQAYDFNQAVNRAILAPNQLEKDAAFQKTGVVVLAQAAGDEKTGKAPARAWYDYAGPDTLIEAVRLIDPSYDPNKTPWPKIPTVGNVPTEGYVVGGVAGVLGLTYLRRRKRS